MRVVCGFVCRGVHESFLYAMKQRSTVLNEHHEKVPGAVAKHRDRYARADRNHGGLFHKVSSFFYDVYCVMNTHYYHRSPPPLPIIYPGVHPLLITAVLAVVSSTDPTTT